MHSPLKKMCIRNLSGKIHLSKNVLTHIMSLTVSANPTMYMAAATALAIENTTPMEPPNSGPRLRDIM